MPGPLIVRKQFLMVLSKSKPDVEWEEVPMTSKPVFVLFCVMFCFLRNKSIWIASLIWLLKPRPFDIVHTYYGLRIVSWLELD